MVFSPDIEAATSDQILPMVKHGLGIGFVPEKSARAAERSGEVTVLDIDQLPPVRTISLIKNTDAPLSLAAAKLEAMLLTGSHPNKSGE